MDLLARHGAPPRLEEMELADGIVLTPRRPRPREGPSRLSRPFDAGEIRQNEAEEPVSKWSPVTLLRALTEDVTSISEDQATLRYRIQAYMDELERRGYQPEPLVRFGFREEIIGGILGPLFPLLVSGEVSRPLIQEWANLAEAVTPDLDSLPPELLEREEFDGAVSKRLLALAKGPFLTHLRDWVAWSPLEDLLNRRPPTPASFTGTSAVTIPQREIDRYVWVNDRFTRTYLTDWRASSLRLEWAYIHSHTEAPCSRPEMSARRIAEDHLGKEMADRYAKGSRRDKGDHEGFVAGELVSPAVDYLKSGRRTEATALFEATTRLSPEDPESWNNYGFCLLPDRPSAALSALEKAANLGYRDKVINVSNRVLALFWQGRLTTALDLAETTLADWENLSASGGYLWSYVSEDVKLIKVADAREYLADLGLVSAHASEDEGTIRKWNVINNTTHQRLGSR